MDWFTVHGGLLFNRKFVPLSFEARGAWITLMLIGHAAKPRWTLGDRETVLILLRREGCAAPEAVLDELVGRRLVDDKRGDLSVHDAASWQKKPSDAPEEVAKRVRRHRAGKRPETPGNAPKREETPTDRQTDKQDRQTATSAGEAAAAVIAAHSELYGGVVTNGKAAYLTNMTAIYGEERVLLALRTEHKKDPDPATICGRMEHGLKEGDKRQRRTS